MPDRPRRFYQGKPRIILDALFGMVSLYFAYAFAFPGAGATAEAKPGTYWLTALAFLAASMYFFVSSSGALAAVKRYPPSYRWLGLLTLPGFVALLLFADRSGSET